VTPRRRRQLLAVTVVLAAAACGEDDPLTTPPTTGGTVPVTLGGAAPDDHVEVQVVEASIVGGTPDGAVRWDVRYPQLEGSAADAEVNEQVRGDATAALEAWRREAEGWGAAADLPSEYVVGSEVTLLDDRLVSTMGSGSAYLSGAAHPVELVSSATFDLTNGARIVVEDLFEPTSPWRDVLLAATREALAAEYGDSVDVASLDLGPATDLSVFALSPTGLRLAFAEGSIGPHALGVPSVTLPYAALSEVARPDGWLPGSGAG
jgi:hypothetical protein